jgi:hypothetical protein
MVTKRDLEGVDLVFASFSQYGNGKTKKKFPPLGAFPSDLRPF